VKLTKASYQFLVRIASLGVFAPELFESIINQLSFSDSRFVLLQETKWTIRSTLASSLDAEQLAFLDLVLYHKEDGLPLH
jgi:Smg protein